MIYEPLGASVIALNKDNLTPFQNLMTEECFEAIQSGEPITSVGLMDGAERAWGALAGILKGSCFEIRSLFVHPDKRRLGGGTMLLETLLHLLMRQETIEQVSIDWIDWGKEGEDLTAFLSGTGFEVTDGTQPVYGDMLENILKASFFKEGRTPLVTPFSDLPNRIRKNLSQELSDDMIEQSMSSALLEDGKATAWIIFLKDQEGGLILKYLYGGNNPFALQSLLRHAGTIAKSYPPETPLFFHAMNDSSIAMADYLIGREHRLSRHGERRLADDLDFSWLINI